MLGTDEEESKMAADAAALAAADPEAPIVDPEPPQRKRLMLSFSDDVIITEPVVTGATTMTGRASRDPHALGSSSSDSPESLSGSAAQAKRPSGGSLSHADADDDDDGDRAAAAAGAHRTNAPRPRSMPHRASRPMLKRVQSIGTLRSTVAELNVFQMFNAYERSDGVVVERVFETVFHPHFQWLLRMSALWCPRSRATWLERVIYPKFLRFVLVFCVGLCVWRLVATGLGGPAFHSVNSDLPFILIHIWIVITYPAASKLLHSTYFIETLDIDAATRTSHLREAWRISRIAGTVGGVAFFLFSGWITVGWTPSFVSPYYVNKHQPFVRRFFGWLSFFSFIVIVMPWVAVLVCFGAIFRIMLVSLESDLVAIYEELFDAIEDTHSLVSINTLASEGSTWSRFQNKLVHKTLTRRRRAGPTSFAAAAGLASASSPTASSRGPRPSAAASAALSSRRSSHHPGGHDDDDDSADKARASTASVARASSLSVRSTILEMEEEASPTGGDPADALHSGVHRISSSVASTQPPPRSAGASSLPAQGMLQGRALSSLLGRRQKERAAFNDARGNHHHVAGASSSSSSSWAAPAKPPPPPSAGDSVRAHHRGVPGSSGGASSASSPPPLAHAASHVGDPPGRRAQGARHPFIKDPHEPAMITKSRDILQATFKPKVMKFDRTLKGLCKILDLPLSLVIAIGLLNLWLPPRAWHPPHSWIGLEKLWRENPLFVIRDFFIVTVGFLSIYLCLYQTSQFTEAARRLNYLAGDVNHSNAIVALEIGRHIDRIDLSYTINEIAISRAFFVTFLEVLAIVVTVIVEVYVRD